MDNELCEISVQGIDEIVGFLGNDDRIAHSPAVNMPSERLPGAPSPRVETETILTKPVSVLTKDLGAIEIERPGVAQRLERCQYKAEVVGSSPATRPDPAVPS